MSEGLKVIRGDDSGPNILGSGLNLLPADRLGFEEFAKRLLSELEEHRETIDKQKLIIRSQDNIIKCYRGPD